MITPMLMPFAISTLACLIMAVVSAFNIQAWEERGFDARPIRWGVLILVSTLFGIAVGFVSFLGTENPLTSASVAIAGYLTVFASTVDVLLLRIPSEPTKMASALGAVLFLIALPTLIPENYLSLLFWGIIILVFGVCSLLGYLGDADMRIFVSFFFLFAWWLPPTEIIAAIFLMALLGFVTRLLFNIGVEKSISQRAKWNPETQRMEAHSSALSPPELEKVQTSGKAAKTHKFFPFGPAILVSFLGVAIFASFNSIIIPGFNA